MRHGKMEYVVRKHDNDPTRLRHRNQTLAGAKRIGVSAFVERTALSQEQTPAFRRFAAALRAHTGDARRDAQESDRQQSGEPTSVKSAQSTLHRRPSSPIIQLNRLYIHGGDS